MVDASAWQEGAVVWLQALSLNGAALIVVASFLCFVLASVTLAGRSDIAGITLLCLGSAGFTIAGMAIFVYLAGAGLSPVVAYVLGLLVWVAQTPAAFLAAGLTHDIQVQVLIWHHQRPGVFRSASLLVVDLIKATVAALLAQMIVDWLRLLLQLVTSP